MIGDHVKKAIKINNDILQLKHFSKINKYEGTKISLYTFFTFSFLLMMIQALSFFISGQFKFSIVLPIEVFSGTFFLCFSLSLIPFCFGFFSLLFEGEDAKFSVNEPLSSFKYNLFDSKSFSFLYFPFISLIISLFPILFWCIIITSFCFFVFFMIKEKVFFELIYRKGSKNKKKNKQFLSDLVKEEKNLLLNIAKNNDELTFLIKDRTLGDPERKLLKSKIINIKEKLNSDDDKLYSLIRHNKNEQIHQLSNI